MVHFEYNGGYLCKYAMTKYLWLHGCVMWKRWLPWLLGKLTPLVSHLMFGEGEQEII